MTIGEALEPLLPTSPLLTMVCLFFANLTDLIEPPEGGVAPWGGGIDSCWSRTDLIEPPEGGVAP